MNVESFLSHHGIKENPFGAEEARHDPVFARLIQSTTSHPDFPKILGRIDQPSTSVVFGEKGSGKTAIRMLIGRKVVEHNDNHPDRRTLLVAYDDLNPVLDRVMQRRRGEMGFHKATKADPDQMLERFRLEDHQDAVLSLAVTKLVDGFLGVSDGSGEPVPMPDALNKKIKKIPRQLRADFAVLCALYDLPRTGAVPQRWRALRAKLRLGWLPPLKLIEVLGTTAAVIAAGLLIATAVMTDDPVWLIPAAGLAASAAVVLWGVWAWRHLSLWSLARKISREVPAVGRKAADLRAMFLELPKGDLANVPWPVPLKSPGEGRAKGLPGNQDSRYQLTARLLAVLREVGYTGMIVLVDRVDEPTLICGQPQRMRAVIWPMLDNKWLQQEGVGLKLLLPLELRHLLHRESAAFFQEARLDKQNLIDRLSWSGATLYDLCTTRLRACREENPDGVYLTDLFEPDVTREMIIDALDQMHQPRDAFKFLYSIILEHCRTTSNDQATYKIPRLTLEAVRRQQSQRVQELYRGVTPA